MNCKQLLSLFCSTATGTMSPDVVDRSCLYSIGGQIDVKLETPGGTEEAALKVFLREVP